MLQCLFKIWSIAFNETQHFGYDNIVIILLLFHLKKNNKKGIKETNLQFAC